MGYVRYVATVSYLILRATYVRYVATVSYLILQAMYVYVATASPFLLRATLCYKSDSLAHDLGKA